MEQKRKKQYIIVWCLIGTILIIDQLVKIMVKTHMHIGEEIPLIGSWCTLHFVENEGFAFGMKIGGSIGKVILSLFRLVASGALLWFLIRLIKKGTRTPVVIYLSLIIVGALGNLIDSCFYGLIFNESYYNVAEMFPAGGGYAPLLQGRVVDMFYFPIISTYWPAWIPFVGGKPLFFFSAIFNVADAAISIGAVWFIIDQLFFAEKAKKKDELQTVSEDTTEN